MDMDVTPLVSDRDILTAGFDGSIYSLNTTSGNIDWKYQAESMNGLVATQDSVFGVTTEGVILSLDRKTGSKQWDSKIKEGTPSGMILVEDQLIVPTMEKYVYSVSMDDGMQIWRYNAGTGVTSKPVFGIDKIYLYSNFSALHKIDPFYLLYAP